MEIAVIGAGYVGLTTAACLTVLGHNVACADNDTAKLQLLRNGDLPFFEPYLEAIVRQSCASGRLEFVTTDEAVRNQVIFICVGTPSLENGEADLSAIDSVARTIARRAEGYRLVVEKSTVPVQTGHELQKHIELYSNNDLECDVASNPEFLREGSAVEDFFHPDRIVLGVNSARATAQLKEIYDPILKQNFPCPVHGLTCDLRPAVSLVLTDVNSAELIKHASNSFLAMKISFINLVADLCEAAGGDIAEVAEGIGRDRRIGRAFLRPGIGFGGSCFPKDLRAFVQIAGKFGCDFSLFQEVERVNLRRVDVFMEKIVKALGVLHGKTIAVWGLAFKPNTDDLRCAPGIEVVRRLLASGARVRAYDPQAMDKARIELPNVNYCRDPYEAAESAVAILTLTEWEEFRCLDWERLYTLVQRPLIFDARNMFSREELTVKGFQHVGIGMGVSENVVEPVETAV